MYCFLAGTQVSMRDGATKPIEEICPGDWVVSFDEYRAFSRPRQTHVREREQVHLDFFGTFVTLGHVYRVVDGPDKRAYIPLIEILRKDAPVVLEDGRLVRASAHCDLGFALDRQVWTLIGEEGRVRIADKGLLRRGLRVTLADGFVMTVQAIIAKSGGFVGLDGLIRTSPAESSRCTAPLHF